MILDDFLEFADAVAASGTGVSQIIGDVARTGTLTKDLGNGEPFYFVVQVDTAYASAGTSIEFQLRSSTLAALTGGTTTTHITTGAQSTASGIAAGTVYVFPLPYGVYQDFIGLWIVTVGAVASGKVNAFITRDVNKWQAYDDAVS